PDQQLCQYEWWKKFKILTWRLSTCLSAKDRLQSRQGTRDFLVAGLALCSANFIPVLRELMSGQILYKSKFSTSYFFNL
ncbi:MAG: hypothetical protein ACK56F_04210, partial [bacterium]